MPSSLTQAVRLLSMHVDVCCLYVSMGVGTTVSASVPGDIILIYDIFHVPCALPALFAKVL